MQKQIKDDLKNYLKEKIHYYMNCYQQEVWCVKKQSIVQKITLYRIPQYIFSDETLSSADLKADVYEYH